LSVPSVAHVALVTPETALLRESERLVPLRPWTAGLSSDSRLELIPSEPLPWLDALSPAREPYDVILVDLPDPTDTVAAKNYTRYFYERVREALAPGGAVAVQAAPLLRAPRVFLNVAATLQRAGFVIRPYEAELPSLGLWGFLLAVRPDDARAEIVGSTRSAPWPSLAGATPVRPLAADTPVGGLDDEAPSHLNELRVLLLQDPARRTHDDATGTSL
jgi:spermidine synthase